MAEHARFTIADRSPGLLLRPQVALATRHNENTNGLLRQYLPQTARLPHRHPGRLDAIADELNGRPRQTLEWKTPSQKLAEVLH